VQIATGPSHGHPSVFIGGRSIAEEQAGPVRSWEELKIKRTYSFSLLHQLVIAAVLILAIGSVGSFWIYSDYQRYQQAFDQWAQHYIRARKLEAKALIDNVIEDIEYRKNGVEQELKTELARSCAAW